MMTFRRISVEQALYGLAFGLALTLRLFHLGQAYLSESEAALALPALELIQGSRPLLGAQSGYVLITSIFFFVFGSSEFAARLGPALAGSLLVFVPFWLRGRLGRTAAVLLAFFLAIEPGLLAVSRQADGLMLAVSFLLLAAASMANQQPVAAGIFAGLALLSGPGMWMGLLGLALGIAWTGVVNRSRSNQPGGAIQPGAPLAPAGLKGLWKTSLGWAAGTLLFFGTLFWIAPNGLNGMASGLLAFLEGWRQESTTWMPLLWIALAVYAPLALVFGIAGIISGWRNGDETDLFLSRWLLAALALAFLYPGRQTGDLVWALVPLWALASRQIARLMEAGRSELLSTAGQATLVLVLILFAWLNFAGLARASQVTLDIQLRLASIAGAVIFVLVLTILVAWGWSVRTAVNGLGWGIGAALLVYTFAAGWHAAGLGPHPEAELWRKSPYPQEADLLTKTIGDVSEWKTGERAVLDVAVVDLPSAGLKWALRDLHEVEYVSFLPGDARPSMLITSDKEMPQLAEAYSGQDFVWEQQPVWQVMTPWDWQRWGVFREAPAEKRQIILWVRTDLFPGAATGK